MHPTEFYDPPSAELLQWLARGPLRQKSNFLRAVRLWVWLYFLYGEEGLQSNLPASFSYADWRDHFFRPDHPKTDVIPSQHRHHPQCRCYQTTADWLFAGNTRLNEVQWQEEMQQRGALPDAWKELLYQTGLFNVTRRTLLTDLSTLAELGWLTQQGSQYARVEQYPERPQASQGAGSSSIIQPDLATIAENLAHEINGHRRFYLHVEYVVSHDATDQVDEWQELLRQIWSETPIPPIALTYYSTVLEQQTTGIVYPVCIYYVQRAPYLCAWGQTARSKADSMDWRNYRLDRISKLQQLDWTSQQVPLPLKQAYASGQLPIPDEIQEKMSAAWGFDFYRPDALLLLRFERRFSELYVKGTIRHDTFEPIDYADIGDLIRSQTCGPEHQQALLKLWQQRSAADAYYTARYRDGDPNVLLRLRAWRPNMEVMLPWHLRQQIAAEVSQESTFYRE